MSTHSGIRAVLFDVGGVIVNARPDPTETAALLGIPTDDLTAIRLVDQAMWAHRDAYDAGTTDKEFWDRVAGDCGLEEIDDHTLAALVAADTGRLDTADPRAIAIVEDFYNAGIVCSVLSNAPHAIADAIKAAPWYRQYFSSGVFSAEVNVCKPQRAIFRHALANVEVEPQAIVFVDDRCENLRAAELLGMKTVLWDGSDEAEYELRSYLP
ncbi:HAD-IA family hydrolase [Schaalia suimastitidis]|uniref:HAD-IA family hydrolase n=1 Tax=Schaalia suimastitidis TaxID=121163 RepID=UPI00040D2851|nr:HAD-IA family hydrolase [Schaalia suimastitidis]